MSKKANPTVIGLFVLVGLALGIGALLMVSSSRLFTHTREYILYFDASLTGAGVIWYETTHGTEVARGVCAVDLTHLGFLDDSSYQNLSEFIGALLAVLGHVALGRTGQSIALRGDSVTALAWATTERPRGSIATNAAMVWTLLCVAADVHVTNITHIPGAENDNCDQLSRRGPAPTTTIVQHAAPV